MRNINIFDSDMFPYMEGEAVKDKTVTLTIKDIRSEVLQGTGGRKETKEVLYFRETTKGFVLNKTNAKRIAQMYGAMTGGWEGKQITLTTEPVQAFGELHNALRVVPGVVSAPQGDEAKKMDLEMLWSQLDRVKRISGFYETPAAIMACRPKSSELPAPDDTDGWRMLYVDARDFALAEISKAIEEDDISSDEVPEKTELEELYPDILGDEADQPPLEGLGTEAESSDNYYGE